MADHQKNFREALDGKGDMSLLGLEGNGGLLFMLVVDVAILAWIIMLVAGALWHTFDILSPISFWAAVPVAAALMGAAFAAFMASKAASSKS